MAAAYSASKAAVIAMTKAIGKDVAGSGVLVNCIAPAVIETPILTGLSQHHIDYMVERIPLGRMGKADEVAALACFLAQRGPLVLDRRDLRHLRRAGDVLMLRFRYLTSEGVVDGTADSPDELAAYTLARPVDPPEVWCAGVTYQRSRDARVEESTVKDVYTLVYDADRPELFMKDAGCRRTVGPGRADRRARRLRLGRPGARDRRRPRRGRRPCRPDDRERRLLPRDRGREPALHRPGEDVRGRLRDRPGRARPRRLGGAARDQPAHPRRGRRRALRRRDLERADAPLVSRARRVAAPRQPGPARKRPPDRDGPRAARRLHARAGPHGRDHGSGDRHALEPRGEQRPT